MAIDHDTPVDLLACGRDAARVWEHAESGVLDEHERSCPHCRSTVSDHDGLGGLVGRLAAQEIEPPQNLLEQVMTAAVTDLRPHDLLDLGDGSWLSRPAAAAAMRHVVDSLDGLRARSCRITQRTGPAPDEPGPLHVTVAVTARFGVDLASVTARVRQVMISTGDRAFGVAVERVDIQVVDVGRDVTGAGVRFHVGDLAVARIAARAARRVPGVVALRPDLQQSLLAIAGSWVPTAPVPPELRSDGVVAAVHGGTAEVSVTVVTRLGYRCRDLAVQVRRAVADEVLASTSLPAEVRVTIADIQLD